MMLRFALAALLLASAPVAVRAQTSPIATAPLRLTPELSARLGEDAVAYTCSPTCTGPSCQCAATRPAPAIPNAQKPQFLVVSVDDCVNANTEAMLQPVLHDGSLRNPDGRPLPLTYYVSLEGCATGGTSAPTIVKARYDQGHEMAVHTRTHTTGTSTGLATWKNEMTTVRTWLANAGVNVARDVKGFRAPYLATNNSMFTALSELGFLYDSSIMESPFWSPVSDGLDAFVWPYTYDSGRAQNCSSWASGNNCPTAPVPGLWEVPLYQFVSTSNENANPTFYGVLDIGGPEAYSGYPRRIEGAALRAIVDLHFNQRYNGNRAPLTFNFHAPGFASPARQRELREILASYLARPNVWAVTTTGLIEWMQNPVPAAQMPQWYAQYCQRHPCTPSTSVANGEDERASSARVQIAPNPARGTFVVDAPLAIPGTATVEVLDLLGRRVRAEQAMGTDRVRVALTAEGLAPGTYFVRVVDARGAASAPQRLVVP